MINPFKDVDWNPDRAGRRRFAVSLMIGFPVIALLLLVVGFIRSGRLEVATPAVIAGAGLLAGLVFWLIPAIARPFYVTWYALACAVGLVVSNVLMGAIFYVVFTGTGMAMRLLGRRPLKTTVDKAASTYWERVDRQPEPGRYFRQF